MTETEAAVFEEVTGLLRDALTSDSRAASRTALDDAGSLLLTYSAICGMPETEGGDDA